MQGVRGNRAFVAARASEPGTSLTSTARHYALDVPQSYSGRVTFYRTLSMEYSAPRDWQRLVTGPLNLYDCDCTHTALLKDPHIFEWAATLKDALANADTAAR